MPVDPVLLPDIYIGRNQIPVYPVILPDIYRQEPDIVDIILSSLVILYLMYGSRTSLKL